MPQAVTCPECDSTLQLKQAVKPGAKIRCPGCKSVFAPEEGAGIRESPRSRPPRRDREDHDDDQPRRRPGRGRSRPDEDPEDRPYRPGRDRSRRDEDPDDRPYRPARRKRGSSGSSKLPLILGLCGGGAALIAGIVVLILVLGGGGSVNEENYAKLKTNMTKSEIIEILGEPESDSSTQELMKKFGGGGVLNMGGFKLYSWQSGEDFILVYTRSGMLIGKSGKIGNKLMSMGGSIRFPGGMGGGGFPR